MAANLYGSPSRTVKNRDHYFDRGITYTNISSARLAARYSEYGFISDQGGSKCFSEDNDTLLYVLAVMHSSTAQELLQILCPNHRFDAGSLAHLPILRVSASDEQIVRNTEKIIDMAKSDWDSIQISWDFQRDYLVLQAEQSLSEAFAQYAASKDTVINQTKKLEQENNSLISSLYGMPSSTSEVVDDDSITLYRPNREEDISHLVSYAVGCMMGRYSLDEPGLIYAHSRNEGFDPSKYRTFPADEDGIVPLTDIAWFPDDAANRFEQFVRTAWPEEHLEENLTFVAESLGKKKGETSRDCIRRYIATGFYKHHLSMYKKRPIYWLFSSGKQRAFQCLVYLHRYNAGTLSRMRTEYVVKLQGKINSRIDQLEEDIPAANSTSHRKKLEKERDTLIKQREELQEFDEKLRHYADQRIELDLDDGVKVNYGKFGDLLAEVKSITGNKPVVEVTT